MKPYPWLVNKVFTRQTRLIRPFTGQRFIGIGFVVLLLASPIALVVAAVTWGVGRWKAQHRPGVLWSFPLVAALAGVLAMVVFGGPTTIVKSLNDIGLAFGDEGTHNWKDPLRRYLFAGVGPGLIVGAFASWVAAVSYKYRTQSFLNAPAKTIAQRRAAARNSSHIAAGNGPTGIAQFGVIEDDKVAWRLVRRGMIVERPVSRLWHGVIVGMSGSGKTVIAANVVYFVLRDGYGAMYADFKDSEATRQLMVGAAIKAGRDVHLFSTTSREINTWWDPFWNRLNRPSENSTMLYKSLKFDETGPGQFYASTARSWLTFAFTVLAQLQRFSSPDRRLGLQSGEGTFDFLLRTCSLKGMTDVLIQAQGTGIRDLAVLHDQGVEFTQRQGKTLDADLKGLRVQLEAVVEAAGPRLRPIGDKPPMTFSAAEDNGDLVYFGFSGTADSETLKILGALLLREVGLAASRRIGATADQNRRDVFIIPDEAGFLEDRGDAFDGLFKQVREAGYWLWPTLQSLGDLPERTQNAIMQNSSTKVVAKCNDTVTGALMSSNLGTIPSKVDRVGETRKQAMFGDQAIAATGDAIGEVKWHPLHEPDTFLKMEVHTAYIWFNLSQQDNPGAAARDSVVLGKWKPPQPIRSMGDEIPQDAPLVRIVPVTMPSAEEIRTVLHPQLEKSFNDIIASEYEQDAQPEDADAGPPPPVQLAKPPQVSAQPQQMVPQWDPAPQRDQEALQQGPVTGVGGQQMAPISSEAAARFRAHHDSMRSPATPGPADAKPSQSPADSARLPQAARPAQPARPAAPASAPQRPGPRNRPPSLPAQNKPTANEVTGSDSAQTQAMPERPGPPRSAENEAARPQQTAPVGRPATPKRAIAPTPDNRSSVTDAAPSSADSAPGTNDEGRGDTGSGQTTAMPQGATELIWDDAPALSDASEMPAQPQPDAQSSPDDAEFE